MVPGAEGEASLDLDGDVVRPDLCSVVRAVNQEAPGPDRREAGQRIGDPVTLLGEAKGGGPRGRVVRRDGDQRADALLVRRIPEIGLDEPGPSAARPRIVGLEGGRGRLGRLEALDDEVGDRPSAPLVGDEPHAVGGVVRRQAFEHVFLPRSRPSRRNSVLDVPPPPGYAQGTAIEAPHTRVTLAASRLTRREA